jgi:hypothetical protein
MRVISAPFAKRSQAPSGAVTLIQRSGSAANLNIHLHCLVLDGEYRSSQGAPVFHATIGVKLDILPCGGLIERRSSDYLRPPYVRTAPPYDGRPKGHARV